MIKPLHPTLKKCSCGLICDRKTLYKHFDAIRAYYKLHGNEKDFYLMHGEVPLNIDAAELSEVGNQP